MVFFGVLLSEF